MTFRVVPRRLLPRARAEGDAPRAGIRPTGPDHRVTSLELLFDLVFVFAFTQVTASVAADPTPLGAARGLLMFALLWWAWCSYAWLGNQACADEGLVRGIVVVATTAMLLVALAIPEAWHDLPGGVQAPLALAVAVAVVRLGHIVVYLVAAGDDEGLRRQLYLTAVPVALDAVLLVVGALGSERARIWWWAAALAIDYLGIYVTGADGWRLPSAAHFAERHGLIVIVALGESIVAIGVGIAAFPLSWPVIGAGALAVAVTVCLWWAYFDVVATVAEHRLTSLTGADRTRLARDSYTYLHFPMVAGVLAGAVGVKKVLGYVAEPGGAALGESLHGLPAWLLVAGPAAYLLALSAFRRRNVDSWNVPRLVAGGLLLLLGPVGQHVPAAAGLGLVAAVVVGLVLFEVVRYREARHAIRHGQPAT
jgi:low temperature requirement protein LtrA